MLALGLLRHFERYDITSKLPKNVYNLSKIKIEHISKIKCQTKHSKNHS